MLDVQRGAKEYQKDHCQVLMPENEKTGSLAPVNPASNRTSGSGNGREGTSYAGTATNASRNSNMLQGKGKLRNKVNIVNSIYQVQYIAEDCKGTTPTMKVVLTLLGGG